MKCLISSSNKLTKYLKPILIFSLLGFILSFFIYHNINNDSLINEINSLSFLDNNLNLLPLHFIFLGILLSFSFIGLCFIIFPLYFLFEIICIFYNFFIFFHIFKFNGLIFSLIYNILLKSIYISLLLIIFKQLFKLTKDILNTLKYNSEKNYNFQKRIKIIAICIILIILNDILIYFFGAKILTKLSFLLK